MKLSHLSTCWCLFIRTHIHMYTCINVCMHVCIYVCMYVCMYVCTYVCLYAYMYAYMHTCIPYIHTYIHRYIHTCTYIHTYIHTCLHVNVCSDEKTPASKPVQRGDSFMLQRPEYIITNICKCALGTGYSSTKMKHGLSMPESLNSTLRPA